MLVPSFYQLKVLYSLILILLSLIAIIVTVTALSLVLLILSILLRNFLPLTCLLPVFIRFYFEKCTQYYDISVNCSCRPVSLRSGRLSLNVPANYCVYVLKFRVCEHGMPYALDINSNGELKRGHVESYPPTIKNIISPLPQCLWPTNSAGQ